MEYKLLFVEYLIVRENLFEVVQIFVAVIKLQMDLFGEVLDSRRENGGLGNLSIN